jgi:uncharacterized protein (TIGR02996 family)
MVPRPNDANGHSVPPEDIFSLDGFGEDEKPTEVETSIDDGRKGIRELMDDDKDQYEDEDGKKEDEQEEAAAEEALSPLYLIPEYEQFITAIAAAPEDRTRRLAFADWLDEHARNDAERTWAQWIRLQCEITEMRDKTPVSQQLSDPYLAQARALHAKEKPLQEYRGEWMKLLPQSKYVEWETAMINGLVDRATILELPPEEDAETLLRDVLRAAPIQFLTFQKLEGKAWHALATLPECAGLGGLKATLGNDFGGNEDGPYGAFDFLYNTQKLVGLCLEGDGTELKEHDWYRLTEIAPTLQYLEITGTFNRDPDLDVLEHLRALTNLTIAPYNYALDLALADAIRRDPGFLPNIYHIDMGQGAHAGCHAFNAVLERYEIQGRRHAYRRG